MEALQENEGRRARKRQQMLAHLSTAAAALFEAAGYDAVTMEQIADRADVARRTLYNHFATKEAVLAYWLEAELARDLAHLEREVTRRRSFVARVNCVLDASAQWCERHPAYLMAYLRHRFSTIGGGEGETPEGAGDIVAMWRQLIAAGQRDGELSKGGDPAQLAVWFHHLYLAALLRWLSTPGVVLRKEFRAIVRLFVDGARARGPKAGAPD
ncbi:TetR/AcrR family transcriptional regulator [Paraburkholderia oxyphila]|uniref:TetR/AcrR family transcriptional regulator n=1 Tax=Paraburkholderia oxyphila TaxID=614212 RepID=UPI000486C541|nr:TetR/AcrR family transcriptional regulator [Paraburkholderia oxyphila]